MGRPRLKIQWLMVAVIIAGILSWGMPSLVDESRRRYQNCQDRAAYHSAQTSMLARWINGLAQQDPQDPEYADLKRRLDFHVEKHREYSGAVYRPWRLWSLGE